MQASLHDPVPAAAGWACPAWCQRAGLAVLATLAAAPGTSAAAVLNGSWREVMEPAPGPGKAVPGQIDGLGGSRALDASGTSLASAGLLAMERVPGKQAPRPRTKNARELDSDNNGLKQWFESLEVRIPGSSVTTADSFVNLRDGHCSNIDIDSIKSQAIQPGNFRLVASGLQVQCRIYWEVKSKRAPLTLSKGTATAIVGSSSIGGTFRLVSDEGSPPLPNALGISDCQAQIIVKSLSFSGDPIATVLQALRNITSLAVSAGMYNAICLTGSSTASKAGTEAFQKSNQAFRGFLDSRSTTPVWPHPLPEPLNDFAEFRHNPGMKLLRRLLNDALGNTSSRYSLNAVMSTLMGPRGTCSLAATGILPMTSAAALDFGVLNIALKDLVLQGLNTWTDLELKQPGPREVGLGFGLAHLSARATIKLELMIADQGPLYGKNLTETFDLVLRFRDLNSSSSAFVALNTSSLGEKSFSQLSQRGCLAQGTQQFLLMQNGLDLGSVNFSLEPDGGGLEFDLARLVNVVVAALLTDWQAALSLGLHHFAAVTLRDLINQNINGPQNKTPSCPATASTYSAPHLARAARLSAGIMIIPAMLCFGIGDVLGKLRARRSAAASRQPPFPVIPSTGEPSHGSRNAALLPSEAEEGSNGGSWDCLAFHPRTQPALRFSLPCLIVVNMVLCIAIIADPTSSTMLSIRANQQEVMKLPPIRSFTLLRGLKDSWDLKLYFTVVLIGLVRGCWPFIRLIIMMICWFSPTSALRPSTRQRLLGIVERFIKWSLMELYGRVMFMMAFRVEVSTTDNSSPAVMKYFEHMGATFELSLYLHPELACHLSIAGTMLSLVLCHVMAACHRRVHQSREPLLGPQRRLRLCTLLHPAGRRGKLSIYGPSIALVLSEALMVAGLLQANLVFTFSGLISLALSEAHRSRTFSPVCLALALPYTNPEPDSFGIRYIQFSFILFVMLVPILYPLLLNVLWCAPLSDRAHRRLFVAAQVMRAWSALDVFLVSSLSTAGQITNVRPNQECGSLVKVPFVAERLKGNNNCLDPRTHWGSGFEVLAVATLMSYFYCKVIFGKCSAALSKLDARSAPVQGSSSSIILFPTTAGRVASVELELGAELS